MNGEPEFELANLDNMSSCIGLDQEMDEGIIIFKVFSIILFILFM